MIALITPTGGRPKQIELCTKFMLNQDYAGKVLWVLVDDVVPTSIKNIPLIFKSNWNIQKVYPTPKWKVGGNTQARNLLEGINVVNRYEDITAVFIIEDDDYYSPQYLRLMNERLKGYDVVGQINTVYYNPIYRGWMRNGNDKHASLFQVAFTPEVLGIFQMACKTPRAFIDMHFFRLVKTRKVNLFNGKDLAVGIKGLPGRSGIGMGHRAEIRMTPDPEFVKLKELIGDDYMYYL
jgi:hypothetical protein